MNCDKYTSYELGEMDKKDFLLHLKTCPECTNNFHQDKLLLQAAKDLNENIETPDVWSGIKDILQNESQKLSSKILHHISDYKYYILRIAAVLMVTILVGLYMLSRPQPETNDQSGILDQAALKVVIEKEQDYMKAIEQLENTATQRLAMIDENLIDLYMNKIRVIDQQINRCKEALQNNPANTHIRRYLLAVLQDKKQTLEEMITYSI